MIRNALILTLLAAVGLGARAQDEMCIELMKPESRMVALFQRIDEFHHGLMFECRQPEQEPYATLEQLHPLIDKLKSQAITLRGQTCMLMDSLKSSGSQSDLERRQEIFDLANQELNLLMDMHMGYGHVYDSLCTAYEIQMVSHQVYGDSLMVRLIAWQDTLVNQGSQIAKCNRNLRASGLESRSDEYRSRYQHISQMQLIHKEFQAKLMQVENQQSRYASARQDEVFYLGPYLVERHDVQSSEGFFDHLREMQGRFQGHREDFKIQNSGTKR